MEQEKKDNPSTSAEAAKPEAPEAKDSTQNEEPKSECKCKIGNFFKNLGLGYSDHKLAYHILAGVAVGVIGLHIYAKHRGGFGHHCC